MIWTRGLLRAKSRLPRLPVEKLSSTRTRCPSPRSRSTMCEPMKPAPPVTRKIDEGAISLREQRFKYGGAGGIKSKNRTPRARPRRPGLSRENGVGRPESFLFSDPAPLQTELVQQPLGRLVLRI